jgi:hypothetical protein
MKYKKLTKEPIETCPVFRSKCKGASCEAFEKRTIESDTSKRGKKSKSKKEIYYCKFFDLEITEIQ